MRLGIEVARCVTECARRTGCRAPDTRPSRPASRNRAMPTIRLIAVLNHLGPQARFALAEALDQVAPGHDIDSEALFEQFLRELDNISPLWQRVPENMVMPD